VVIDMNENLLHDLFRATLWMRGWHAISNCYTARPLVPLFHEENVNGLAGGIHRAIQVASFPTYPDVRLVHPPTAPDRAPAAMARRFQGGLYGWVRRWYRYHPLPEELGVRLAPHPAQATGRSFKVSGSTPVDRCSRVTFTRLGIQLFLWISARLLVGAASHPATSAPFRGGQGPIRRVMSSPCLSVAGLRFLAVLCPLWIWPSLTIGLLDRSRPQRGFHVPHRQATSGELSSLRLEPGTAPACSLTMLAFAPRRTYQPRTSPLPLRRFNEGFTCVQLDSDFS
jgi:hypothetical protein